MFSFFGRKAPGKRAAFAGVVSFVLAGMALASCSQPGSSVAVDAVTPVISMQPASGVWNVTEAEAFSLSVSAAVTDGGTLSYQWYSNTTNSEIGGAATGTDSASLTLAKEHYTTNDIYYFYVVVTNTVSDNGDGGIKTAAVTSNVAAVTVTGNDGLNIIIPEGLKDTWLSEWDEAFIITAADFTYTYGGDVVYAGTIVNHRADGNGAGGTAGYITIQYTEAMYQSPDAIGNYYIIHYKDLTATTMSIAGASNASYEGGEGTATIAEAEATFTVAGGYFTYYSDVQNFPFSNVQGGSVNKTVAFTGFGDEEIDLTADTEANLTIGDTLTVTVEGDFDASYYWELNGAEFDDTTVNTMSLYIDNTFHIGDHTLVVMVSKGGVYYSKELTFTVAR